MKLSEIQSLFKRNLLAAEADPQALLALKPAGRLNLTEAFEVYHRSYITRLTEVLHETYETVCWVLGENLFNDLCRRYIECQPSVAYNLLQYGESMPSFIRDSDVSKGIPFLEDLAQFEWQIKKVQQAPTPEPLPAEQARDLLRAADVQIRMIDAMEIFDSNYAVCEVWRHRKEPAYMFEDLNWNRPESVLIHKKRKHLVVQTIDPMDASILKDLQAGFSLNRALALRSRAMTPERIAQLYDLMMKTAIIEDVTTLEE